MAIVVGVMLSCLSGAARPDQEMGPTKHAQAKPTKKKQTPYEQKKQERTGRKTQAGESDSMLDRGRQERIARAATDLTSGSAKDARAAGVPPISAAEDLLAPSTQATSATPGETKMGPRLGDVTVGGSIRTRISYWSGRHSVYAQRRKVTGGDRHP
jgi:hypothetical protein